MLRPFPIGSWTDNVFSSTFIWRFDYIQRLAAWSILPISLAAAIWNYCDAINSTALFITSFSSGLAGGLCDSRGGIKTNWWKTKTRRRIRIQVECVYLVFSYLLDRFQLWLDGQQQQQRVFPAAFTIHHVSLSLSFFLSWSLLLLKGRGVRKKRRKKESNNTNSYKKRWNNKRRRRRCGWKTNTASAAAAALGGCCWLVVIESTTTTTTNDNKQKGRRKRIESNSCRSSNRSTDESSSS